MAVQSEENSEAMERVMNRWRRLPLGKVIFVSLVIGAVAFYAIDRARSARPYKVHHISSALGALALHGGRTIGVKSPGAMQITVYNSYTCGLCRDWWIELDSLIESGADLVLHVKHLAPPSGTDPSYRAALAAECAGDQDVFPEYHDLLFNSSSFDDEQLRKIASEAGVPDAGQFERCIARDHHRDEIIRHRLESAAPGITATPSTVVADRVVVDTFPISKLTNWGR